MMNAVKDVAVLTPTYNRKHLLPKLYNSLCAQSDRNFEWVIVDDGSNDGTDALVAQWSEVSPFSISYYKKENGGKHTALNYGIAKMDARLIFIVDSDDRLTTDAIAVIRETDRRYGSETDLCGYSFLRARADGKLLSKSQVPQDGMKESFVDCRLRRGNGGDMAEVWVSRCLREYPFPEYPGEKFLGEDVVWIQMSNKYKLRFFNKIIYRADYLDEGLTQNRRKHNIASPRGCVKRAEVFLNAPVGWKLKVKSMLQYQIYGRFADMTYAQLYAGCKQHLLFVICFIPAVVLKYQWSRK